MLTLWHYIYNTEFFRSTKLFATVCLVFLLSSLYSQVYLNNLEDSSISNRWINLNLVTDTNAFSGNRYSIATPNYPYGLGLESEFPESVHGTNVKMNIDGWVKSNTAGDKALFVVTVVKEGSTVFWRAINFKELITDDERWVHFEDNITIPGYFTKTATIKTYLWNEDQKDTIAIDDLRFRFDILPIQSFLPDISSVKINRATETDSLIMMNDFYTIYYDNKRESISFYSISGELLIENILMYSESVEQEKKVVKKSNCSLVVIKRKKWGSIILLESSDTEIKLICKKTLPVVEVKINKSYSSDKLVKRESIIFQSGMPINQVFRANRKVDTVNFQQEYWINKQGVQFGRNRDSWMIYHTPEISSLQLNTHSNQLWVNLDFHKDHPFLHFPIIDGQQDVKIDQSKSLYATGDTKSSAFKIYLGQGQSDLPRLMKNPSGYLATYIWTEHADFTDITTNRATYFGSEKITQADSSIGGFVKYNIPVTKSVFYFNPDEIRNDEISGGVFPGFETSIMADKDFEDYLIQLNNLGHEICLHTPEQYTSSKKAMKKALKYMTLNFASSSWVDHGYNNGLLNNREDLVCDGTIKNSDHYAIKLWKKNNVDYFWNPYYEDYGTFDTLQFGELLSKPHYGFGDHIPDPDYYQHPTRTDNLWHWPTKSVLYVERNDLWDFYFSEAVLSDFVNGWCVQFNHCYPAWVDPEKGFWYFDENKTIRARPGFNKALERMAKFRDEGLLNITTVKEFVNYQLSVEKVDYEVLSENEIKLTNKGRQNISGLSLVTSSNQVTVDGIKPPQKKVNDELIFWFDLNPGESKIIETFDYTKSLF